MTTTKRNLDTYSPLYLANRKAIRAYQSVHRDEIREYMREYMPRYYAENPEQKRFQRARCLLRGYLTGRVRHSKKAIALLGCTRAEFAKNHGLTEQQVINLLQNGFQIDHVLPLTFFKAQPHYMPYASRWYNLQIISRSQNTAKQHSMPSINVSARILGLMQREMTAGPN